MTNRFTPGNLWSVFYLLVSFAAAYFFQHYGFLTFQQSAALFVMPLIITAWVGVKFVQDLHELDRIRMALRYLVATFFGIGLPKLTVEQGWKKDDGREAWLRMAGGPGILHVQEDSVVLIESLGAKPFVCLKGKRILQPLQSIRAILSVQSRRAKIGELTATTKDGIPITVRDIQFGFQLISDEEIKGKVLPDRPNEIGHYNQALLRLIYYRSIRDEADAKKNALDVFTESVTGIVKKQITEYINTHQADAITVPRHQRSEPRQEIAKQLQSDLVAEKFAGVGAKLVWVDVGNFDLEEDAEKQRLNTWKAGWAGKAKVTLAYGDARKFANQELGRAEAQAEMLNGIIHALEEANLSDDSDQNLRNVILVKTAQMFESMTSLYQAEEDGEDRQPNSSERKDGDRKGS